MLILFSTVLSDAPCLRLAHYNVHVDTKSARLRENIIALFKCLAAATVEVYIALHYAIKICCSSPQSIVRTVNIADYGHVAWNYQLRKG
jgi:hypothetical protein